MDAIFTEILQLLAKALIVFLIGHPAAAVLKTVAQPVVTDSTIVTVHISCAVIALLAGLLAMMFRKGSGLHGAAGSSYFVSMIGMTTTAVYGATFIKPNRINVIAALLTLYLVVTAWVAAKRRAKTTNAFDVLACAFAFGVAFAGIAWGFQSRTAAAPLTVFATIGLLFAVSDVRMLRRGGVGGAERIKRHVVRMCVSLLMTLLSFYPGQSRNLPEAMRGSALGFIPHILIAASMVYWLIRLRTRKRERDQDVAVEPAELHPQTVAA
jgi:uncharacterized membrane protein